MRRFCTYDHGSRPLLAKRPKAREVIQLPPCTPPVNGALTLIYSVSQAPFFSCTERGPSHPRCALCYLLFIVLCLFIVLTVLSYAHGCYCSLLITVLSSSLCSLLFIVLYCDDRSIFCSRFPIISSPIISSRSFRRIHFVANSFRRRLFRRRSFRRMFISSTVHFVAFISSHSFSRK